MKQVLITGGCGFVGSNLAVRLAAEGYQVTAFDNLSRRGSHILRDRLVASGIRCTQGDIRKADDLNALQGNFALMIECSAEPSVLVGTKGEDARRLLDVNLLGAINCFEWARARQVPVIFLSSSRVYPYDRINRCRYEETETRFELSGGCAGVAPQGVAVDMPLSGIRSLYGASKLASEVILQEYAAQYGLPAIINRCGVIAGPWQLGKADQGVFTFWLANHYFEKPLCYIGFGGQGKQVRDLLHVDDLADLIAVQARCLVKDAPLYRGDIFNAGGGRYAHVSLKEATALCQELTRHTIDIGSVSENRPADLIWFVTDNSAAERAFGWSPRRSARQIFEDTLRWLQTHDAEAREIFLEGVS